MIKYIKFIVINLIVFAVLFFLFSLILPEKMQLTGKKEFNRNLELVKPKFSSSEIKSWNLFSGKNDPENYKWKNDTLEYETYFENKKINHQHFFKDTNNNCVMTWRIEQNIGYNPIKKINVLLFSNKVYSLSFDSSLKKLE